jgi:predicted Zn-dependent peptidase
MPLIVENIPGVKSASLAWWLPVGSATDPDGLEGRATMLAELLQRGSADRSSREMANALDSLGVLHSVEPGVQFVRISATFVGSRVGEVLPLLTDLALRPRFEADAIEPARALSQQALAGLADNPQQRAAEVLVARHAAQPLHKSTLGTEAGLAALTREDLVRGWTRHARPRGSILTLAGDVEINAVANRMEKLLGGATPWTGLAPEITPGPAPVRGTYHHEPEDANQVQIYLAHEAPPESSPDARLERVVASVLSGGSSARLFSEVREKRALCYSVYSSYASDRHFGRVVGYVGTTPDKAQTALDVMVEQLRRVDSTGAPSILAPVTADEFDRARIGYKSRLVASGESSGARAAALASDWHRLGRARTLTELASEMENLSLKDVNDYLARRAMGPLTVVTLGPRELSLPA